MKLQKILLALGVSAVALTGCAESNESKPKETKSKQTETKKETKKRVGDTVESNGVKMTVKKVEEKNELDTGYSSVKAKGKFVILTVKADNQAKEKRTTSDHDFNLIVDGNKNSTSSDGEIALGDKALVFDELSPQTNIEKKVIFDISKNANLNKAYLEWKDESDFNNNEMIKIYLK